MVLFEKFVANTNNYIKANELSFNGNLYWLVSIKIWLSTVL